MNVPVVATAHGGVLDIVRDGIDGRLVRQEYPAVMAEAIMCAAELNRNASSRARIEKCFGLKTMIDNYESIYKELTGNCAEIA